MSKDVKRCQKDQEETDPRQDGQPRYNVIPWDRWYVICYHRRPSLHTKEISAYCRPSSKYSHLAALSWPLMAVVMFIKPSNLEGRFGRLHCNISSSTNHNKTRCIKLKTNKNNTTPKEASLLVLRSQECGGDLYGWMFGGSGFFKLCPEWHADSERCSMVTHGPDEICKDLRLKT